MESVCFFKKIPNLLGSWHRVMLAWEITSLGWMFGSLSTWQMESLLWGSLQQCLLLDQVRIPEPPSCSVLVVQLGQGPTWPAVDYVKPWAKHPLTIFTVCSRLFYMTISASAGTISAEYLEVVHQCISLSVLQQVLPGGVPSMARFSILDAKTLTHEIVSIKWSKHSRSCLENLWDCPKFPHGLLANYSCRN